jgi:hypothetical protein
LLLELVANGSPSRVTKATLFNDGRFQPSGAYADLSVSRQQPVSGFSIAIADVCGRLILEPTGTLASGSITMPANPKDGQLCRIASTQTITTLTLLPAAGQAIAGALNSIAANGFVEYSYVASAAKWFRTG